MPTPEPIYRYDFEAENSGALPARGSAARHITHHERSGINVPGIRGRIPLPRHTADQERGTVSLWVMPLDDLNPATHHAQHKMNNPYHDFFTIISDHEAVSNFNASSFGITYSSDWHPVFYAKLFQGTYSEGGFGPIPKVVVSANYFSFEKLEWYLITLTWDKAAGRYSLYANGILVGSPDQYADAALETDLCGPILFLGNPLWVYSEVTFFDEALTATEVAEQFSANTRFPNIALQARLEQMYCPQKLLPLDAIFDSNWCTELSMPMNAPDTLTHFYLQGNVRAPIITPEGLRITTPRALQANYASVPVEQQTSAGLEHIYLWTQRTFEGDLYIAYEFKTLQRGGLSLLMTQCAGMQREDFLADYAPRTHGTMKSVCWEDIRNYHWEYYREMHDTRHDLVSHAMLKNPWYRPMAFQIEKRLWNLDEWYRLEYWQVGSRILGAINGKVVIDANDRPNENNGPVLLNGRIALRCMYRTDIVVRNLLVKTRAPFQMRSLTY